MHRSYQKILRGLLLAGGLFLSAGTAAAENTAGTPVRIVSLSPALTELSAQLGAGDALIGRSSACNYPESVQKLPVLGDFGKPNPEQLILRKTQLLITNALADPQIEPLLRSAGVEVICRQCANRTDYAEWVKLLGKKLNRQAEAERELKRIDDAMREIRKHAEKIPEGKKLRAVWVIWDSPLLLAGKGSLPDDILTQVGFKNLAGDVEKDYFYASFEWLAAQDPEWIIWIDLPEKKWETLRKTAPWNMLSAVRNDRVFRKISPDLLLRPGPRLFDGMRQLQKIFYPND